MTGKLKLSLNRLCSIFCEGDSLYADISVNYPYMELSDCGIGFSDIESVVVNIEIRGYDLNDVEKKVAWIELRMVSGDSLDGAFELCDDLSEDSYGMWESVNTYVRSRKKLISEEDRLNLSRTSAVTLCELRTFYVSPEFRGKGVSKALIAIIPLVMEKLMRCPGMIFLFAHVNPFRDQVSLEQFWDTFKAGEGTLYMNGDDPEGIGKIAEKALVGAGFAKVDKDRNYVATVRSIKQACGGAIPLKMS